MEKVKMYNKDGQAFMVPVGTVKVPTNCYRCGGSGKYSYNQIDQDRCYGCGGSGKRLGKGFTERQWANKQKRDAAKAKKAQERFEAEQARKAEIREGNKPTDDRILEVVEIICPDFGKIYNRPKSVELLLDIMRKSMTECRPYTQKQKDLVEKILADHYAQVKAEEEASERTSHVGEIGERMKRELTCVRTYSGEGHYGFFYILTLEDVDGNTFVYKGSKDLLEKGEKAMITFTVKAHDSYRGVKQTIIARPKK